MKRSGPNGGSFVPRSAVICSPGLIMWPLNRTCKEGMPLSIPGYGDNGGESQLHCFLVLCDLGEVTQPLSVLSAHSKHLIHGSHYYYHYYRKLL